MISPKTLIAAGFIFFLFAYVDLKLRHGETFADASWFGKCCALAIPAILVYWIWMTIKGKK